MVRTPPMYEQKHRAALPSENKEKLFFDELTGPVAVKHYARLIPNVVGHSERSCVQVIKNEKLNRG